MYLIMPLSVSEYISHRLFRTMRLSFYKKFKSNTLRGFMAAGLLLFIVLQPARGQINMHYYMQHARHHLAEEEPRKAMPYLNRVTALNDSHYKAYFLRGVAKYHLKDYYGAIEDLDKCLKINPFYTQAFHYRGIVKSQQHNYYAALQDFNQALDISPYKGRIMTNKGIVQLSIGHHASAIQSLNKALQFSASPARVLTYRGRAFAGLGQADSALADYRAAIQKDPLAYQAFLFRGDWRKQQKDYVTALKDYNRAIRIHRNRPEAYFKRARVKMQLKDYGGAIQDFSQVLELAPNSAIAYYNQALAYARRQDYQKALQSYNRVLELQPGHPITLFNRGNLYMQKDAYASAVKDYNRAIDALPDFEEAYINRAIAHQHLGNRSRAMQDRQKAQQINNYKNTPAFEKRDTSRLKEMISLDAGFYDQLGGNEQRIAHMLQSPEALKLMPLMVLRRQKPLNDLFSARLDAYNRQHSDSLFLGFQDSIPANRSNTKDSVTVSATLLYRALQHRSKLNFNQASQLLQKEKQQAGAMYLFAAGNTHALMTNFIRSMERHTPEINMEENRNSSRSQSSYDYSPAINHLQSVIKKEPGFVAAHYNLGILYAHMQQYSRAIKHLNRAISLKHDFGAAYFNRAVLRFKTGAQKQACHDLSKAGEHGVGEAYQALKAVCQDKP